MKKKSTGLFTTIASSIRVLSLAASAIAASAVASWAETIPTEVEIRHRPSVGKSDRVTLRISVKGNGGRPVMNLTEENFAIYLSDPVNQRFEETPIGSFADWKNPQESDPPTAWIVTLLDLSGSMLCPADETIRDRCEDYNGQDTKLKEAIAAMNVLTEEAAQLSRASNLAVIPFARGNDLSCPKGNYPVNASTLGTLQFFAPDDYKIEKYLNEVAAYPSDRVCGSTNLYDPIAAAVNFLADQSNPNFHPFDPNLPDDRQPPQPKLAIILLSDGFHNSPNEAEEFAQLKQTLENNSNVAIIHALGYGLTPEELGTKCGLGRAVRRGDLGVTPCPNLEGTVPPEEFVDKERLDEIAAITGGISAVSGDPDEIAAAFRLFLESILGEYEIVYTDPFAERAAKHAVRVGVRVGNEAEAISNRQIYSHPLFGRSLPASTRLTMIGAIVALLAILGALPYLLWQYLLSR